MTEDNRRDWEEVASTLERDKAEGTIGDEERRWLATFRNRARASATGARTAVERAYVGVLRRRHPGTDWHVLKPDTDKDDDAPKAS